MAKNTAAKTSLPPDWGQVIDKVDVAVTAMLAEVRLREQALQDEARLRETTPALATEVSPRLEAMRLKLLGVEERAEKAAAAVREADAGLGEREDSVSQWIERTRRLAHTLAELADRG